MNGKVDLVKSAYAKFETGGIDGLLTLLSVDTQCRMPESPNSPYLPARSGREHVRPFFEGLFKTQEDVKADNREFMAHRARVVVLGTYKATIRETDRTFTSDHAHVYSLEKGRIKTFDGFRDSAAIARAYQKAAAE